MVPRDADEAESARNDAGLEPRIVVAGCGGAGCNVVSQVYEKGFPGIETLAVNTDAGALERTRADVRVLLAQGVSVDGNPLLAQFAAEACRDLLASATAADIVFVVCGLGGGTGTGAAPVLADAARQAGAHTVGIAILPFSIEGRGTSAEEGVARLREACDSVVVLENDRLLQLGAELTLRQAFAFMDKVVLTILEGVLEHLSSELLTTVADEVETVAREMQSEPEGLPVQVATPVIEAFTEFEPVAFDATGFIGLR